MGILCVESEISIIRYNIIDVLITNVHIICYLNTYQLQ